MEDRYINSKLHRVKVTNEGLIGPILDIGGGGEGVIGNIYGKEVIAIDTREDELLETSNASIKLVMDGSELKFIDNNFPTVTLFYSLMYMDRAIKERVLSEAYRVLQVGGKLVVWDNTLPNYDGSKRDIYLSNLELNYDDRSVKSTYGVLLDGKEQDNFWLKELLEGFNMVVNKEEIIDGHFKVEAIKK